MSEPKVGDIWFYTATDHRTNFRTEHYFLVLKVRFNEESDKRIYTCHRFVDGARVDLRMVPTTALGLVTKWEFVA